ncbi:hypothetical protein HYC85_027214 [Camellia sinensis]|uniref:C2H2-type domain-containing protein n=1 Tax=Camellia sinensis TaxID=4442 RepID=A0A7J7G720_CAMSI|nr:hypothetical protein HYC85_027214 [Camellia sinensis]
MMMNSLILDDNMSNLTSASNEASISSSNRNEVGSLYPQQQSFASPNQPPLAKKKRNLPGNPDPEAEVMALSPKTLMATNRFICEICNKGFQRDQNLQLHRRGHNLPWKLKQRANKEVIKKKVYVCPEPTCVHHDPSRALGDLTGIKKHFSRKHGEKKWKCEKCSKRYAVQSDWKAHSKICGTREYRCDCGTLFSRRDSFITHRAFCDALAEESARSITLANHPLLSSSQPPITSSSHFNLHLQNHHLHNPPTLQPFPLMKREQQDQSFNNLIRPPPELPPWLACQPLVGEGGAPPPIDLSTQLFSSRLDQHQHHHSFIHHNENPNPSTSLSTTTTTPSLPSFQPTSSPHMSATALLQKAAQMGVTMSKPCPSESLILNRPHQAHHMSCSSTSLASSTAGSGLDLSSREEMEISGFSQSLASFGNKAVVTSGYMEQVGATMVGSSLPCGSGFEGSSSFEEALNGMLNPRMESHFQETFSKPADMETHLRRSNEGRGGGGGNDGLTRDFLGLRTISHRGFPNMAGLDHMNSPSSSYDQQNQNQTPWQG